MRVLGYPATWRTGCFIRPNCEALVYAHTNGFGDFVLLDSLGWPWPVHDCYADRFLIQRSEPNDRLLSLRPDRLSEYRHTNVSEIPTQPRKNVHEIVRVEPISRLASGPFAVFGRVQDYVENRANRILATLGDIGQRHFQSAIHRNRSQLTVVTSDFESFTAFANLANIVVGRNDTILAEIEAIPLVGVQGMRAVFVARNLVLMPASKL